MCTHITYNYRTNKQCVRILPTITRQTNSVYAYYLQLQDKQTVCTHITYNYKTNKQCVRILPTATRQTNSVYAYYLQLQDKQTVCTHIAYNYNVTVVALKTILSNVNVTDKSKKNSTLYSTYKITNIYQQIKDLYTWNVLPHPRNCPFVQFIDAQADILLASDR